MRLYCELKTKRDTDIARLVSDCLEMRIPEFDDPESQCWLDVKDGSFSIITGLPFSDGKQVSLPELLSTALAGQEDVVRDIANILNGKDDE